MIKIFPEDQNWYKGNLHTHTNCSDGEVSPEDALALYKANGYSFVAITDHNKYFAGSEESDFVTLGGVEFDAKLESNYKAIHIIGIGLEHEYVEPLSRSVKSLSETIKAAGGLAILGHPAWSLLDVDDMISADGCFATEIYSSVSYLSGRGDSSVYTDTVASRGCIKKILGVDDTHYYTPDNNKFKNWICMKLPSLSRENIFAALRSNAYYCSQGPEIHQIEIDNDTVNVYCSDVQKVTFYTNLHYEPGRLVVAENSPLNFASYKVDPRATFLRVECEDKNGLRACSQYLKFSGGSYIE